jgi:PBP1b-binding outer membrane lipoprotein LpoB
MKLFFFAAIAAVIFASCDSRPESSKEWEQVLEFPAQKLDPGSNTLQFDLPQTAKTFAEANGMDPKAIQTVELLSCEAYLEDGNNFDDVEGVTFQLSSKNAKMQQLAIAENKDKGKKSLKLDIAKKNDAAAHFNSDKVIAVVEVNAAEGGDKEYKFKAKVKFRFISKQNDSK